MIESHRGLDNHEVMTMLSILTIFLYSVIGVGALGLYWQKINFWASLFFVTIYIQSILWLFLMFGTSRSKR